MKTKDVVMHAMSESGALDGKKKRFASTGFEFLDNAIGGFAAGEICVVGARPACGKSATLLHIANRCANDGFRPLFLSLEDSPVIVGERLSVPHTGIPLGSLRVDGHAYYRSSTITALSKRDWADIEFAFGVNRTLEAIKLQITDEVIQNKRDVVILDYLTKIYAPGHNDTRTMINYIVNELRELVTMLHVPLYLGCQLSRPQWSKELNRFLTEPETASLKESSVVEEAADLVMLSWSEDGTRYTKVGKNKYGSYMPTWKWSFAKDGSIRAEVVGGDL